MIREHKPYLVALEERVEELDYGEIQVQITVRAGVVEKMAFWSGKTWMRQKTDAKPPLDSKSKQ